MSLEGKWDYGVQDYAFFFPFVFFFFLFFSGLAYAWVGNWTATVGARDWEWDE